LHGNDLFIAHSSADSQCIFKLPNYLTNPAQAMAQGFVFSLDGSDYVGMAFNIAGELYAAEGSFSNNRIFKYTGTATPYPGPALAAVSNYATRTDMGNAGMPSYFANLAFDAAGNLWVSDYLNHRVVVFDAANLGGTNTFHVLTNLTGSIPVANTDAALNANTSHLFAEPEGLDFDADGNLWVANNNDGNGAGGVQTTKTALVKLTPVLQQNVLATVAGGSLTPTVAQSNADFFIYQVPNLANNGAVRPQFGGLQIDRTAARLFVNEQIAGDGRGYDLATIAAIGTSTAANDLNIVSTNPGNGGIALVNAPIRVPDVLSATPGTGSSAGGTSVVIGGTGFTATAAVTFGGGNATSFVVDSDLQITATTPAGLGTVDIAVTSLAGSGTLAGGFTYVSLILKGINLSGFSDRGQFYHPASHAQMDFYKAKGMNFFRIPIWWERLQPTLSAAFDAQVWSEVQDVITYGLSLGCTVMINNHCMGGRQVVGTGRKLGDPQLPYAALADFWVRIAAVYKSEPRVWFDLINEPESLPSHGHATPTDALVTIYNETIAAIRSEGAMNLIVLEGNGFNNAKAFNQNPWYNPGTTPPTSGAAFAAGIVDAASNWCVSCHNYPDAAHDGSGPAIDATILRTQFQNVMDWSTATAIKVMCGEWSVIAADPNGQAVTTDYLDWFEANQDKVLVWSWWDGRETAWMGEPPTIFSDEAPEDARWAWLKPYLT
jgi:endoglucanase